MDIPESVITKLKNYLRKDGINFFKDLKDKYGEINCVYSDGGIPHPVHLREGMQIRNFLRGLPECKDWSFDFLEDHWVDIVEEAIK